VRDGVCGQCADGVRDGVRDVWQPRGFHLPSSRFGCRFGDRRGRATGAALL